MGKRNRSTVMGVEALGLNQARAVQPEAALSTMLRGFFQHARIRTGRRTTGRGKDPNFAVGENTVNVEDYELNFAGASISGWFGHRRDFSIRSNSSRGSCNPRHLDLFDPCSRN